MTKVFIGMPAYNGERFIKDAIDSLIAQSFTDWRLVISDDCSKDSTEKICRTFAERDNRITYIRQEKNLGMDANFNYLLQQATEPYFMWAAQDDIWREDFLKTCVHSLDTNPEVGVAFTGLVNTDSYGRIIREYPGFYHFSGKKSLRTVVKHLKSPEIMGRGNLMYALIRTSLAKKVNALYVSKTAWGADIIFAFGLVAHGGVYIDPIVHYEKRHGGYSNPHSTKNDDPNKVTLLTIHKPKNMMFPFGRVMEYLHGYRSVCKDTPYYPIVCIITALRTPRAFFIHLKKRNFKKFISNKMNIIFSLPKKIVRRISLQRDFKKDFEMFKALAEKKGGRFLPQWNQIYPCLYDKTVNTAFDAHYVYHCAWAARIVAKVMPALHIDISSKLEFSTMVSAFVPVDFYDFRPANLVGLSQLHSKRGDLMALPFKDASVESISCMHTIEHIGLGRYGDPLDPEGDLKAIHELKRVTRNGGTLIFVTPVGKSKLAYNAHRIYSYDQIISYFDGFELKEFALIPDNASEKGIIINASKELSDQQNYGCGCFWFVKK